MRNNSGFAVNISESVENFKPGVFCIEASQLGSALENNYQINGSVFHFTSEACDDENEILFWVYRSGSQILKIWND